MAIEDSYEVGAKYHDQAWADTRGPEDLAFYLSVADEIVLVMRKA